jgi:hypothetical protein
MEHQRHDLGGPEIMHAQQDDVVIAGRYLLFERAVKPCARLAPSVVERQSSPAKRPAARELSCLLACSWWSPSTLMPSRPALRSAGQVVEVCATQTETSGGSSDTETNELAASPAGSPSMMAATAAMPVGNAANTRRSCSPLSRVVVMPALSW